MPRRAHHEVNSREKMFIALTFVSLVLAGAILFSGGQQPQIISEMNKAGISDLSTDGFVKVTPTAEIVNGDGRITLESDCYSLTAGTETGQSQSIIDGLNGFSGPRPNTHDLMRDAFDSLGVKVLMVKVTELRDRNFFSKLLLQQGDTILSLDEKPSDGIALAIRTNSTIYFNETLLAEMGQKTC